MESQQDKEYGNLDTNIAGIIRDYFSRISPEKKEEFLEELTEDEFISHRVDVYLRQHAIAAMTGSSELAAHELSIKEALDGLEDVDYSEEE
jgi:hypothetical protein